jgi:hypothetical protein
VPQIIKRPPPFDVASTDVDQHIRRIAIATAELLDHVRREERIVAIDRAAAEERRLARTATEERAARCNLRASAVVHEHELGVDARLVAEIIVREQATGLALVRTLIIVVGREVELVGRSERPQRAVRVDREIAAVAHAKTRYGRRSGSTATEQARLDIR